MTRYAIGLGSNLGDRLGHLRAAVDALGELGSVVSVSGLYETAPVGGPEQGPYLNAVVVLDSDLGPSQLLAALHVAEEAADRVRRQRWGPRTLDLDIVSSDGPPVDTPDLVVPHPMASQRRFVLEPLASIWRDAPVGGTTTAGEAVRLVQDQEADLLARHWQEGSGRSLGQALVIGQLLLFTVIGVAMAVDGTLPDGDVGGTRILGAAFSVFGAALAFVSSRRLGPSLTPHPDPRPETELVETGPYSLARHPIYGGVFLFIFGATMIVDSLSGSLASLVLLGFFYIKTEYEERRLRMRYQGYRAYRQRVRRRLIPFLI